MVPVTQNWAEKQDLTRLLNTIHDFALTGHNNLQSHGFKDKKDLFIHEDTFDDLKALEPPKEFNRDKDKMDELKQLNRSIFRPAFKEHEVPHNEQPSGHHLKSCGSEDEEDVFGCSF